MGKFSAIAFGLTLVLAAPSVALAAPAPAAAAAPTAAYTTNDTTIGTLLADPAAKAIVDKHIPGLSENPSIAMASGATLRAIQPMAGDKITDQALYAIDAELKALKPAKK